MTSPDGKTSLLDRRFFLGGLTAGTLITLLGAEYVLADDEDVRRANAQPRPDGRARVPPHQHLLKRLRPMGGVQGNPSPANFRLRVHGEVEAPFTIDFAELLGMPQVEQTCDVHCVTKWTVLDSRWTGVRVSELAARARLKRTARYVVFEAAAEYTANIPLREALKPNVLVAHRHEGAPLMRPHGAPVRARVPDTYFGKSAKWLTGVRFVTADKPGYWETRGYHNHADPWKEERYA